MNQRSMLYQGSDALAELQIDMHSTQPRGYRWNALRRRDKGFPQIEPDEFERHMAAIEEARGVSPETRELRATVYERMGWEA